MKKILIIMLIISLPFYILLKSVEINTFNKDIYLNSYEKHDAPAITGKSMEELEYITETILTYLREGLDRKVLEPYFNDREVQHMEDVKILFKNGFILKNVLFFLSLVLIITFVVLKEQRTLAKGLFYGIFIWWGFMLLLFILSMLDFTKYFTYFHLIFFDNDLWLLNPKTDLLIQMLPEAFFINIFKRIVLLFMIILAIIQTIAYIFMKKGKGSDEGIIKF
ncbi:MAG: TIGR01906 family membrane protein [Tissierellia bacterium]|nr:TIGR01906 family membrane protein [Tissierellia bacterium]